jgi:hypothetical protein
MFSCWCPFALFTARRFSLDAKLQQKKAPAEADAESSYDGLRLTI